MLKQNKEEAIYSLNIILMSSEQKPTRKYKFYIIRPDACQEIETLYFKIQRVSINK